MSEEAPCVEEEIPQEKKSEQVVEEKKVVEEEVKEEKATEEEVKEEKAIEEEVKEEKADEKDKMKIQKTANRLEREVKSLTSRTSVLSRKNAERERIIAQLREGSKILEDQLRLMDKKYIELRSKLDWTRNHSKAVVKKMQKEANELRAKWALAGGLDMELNSTKKRKKKKSSRKGKKNPQDEDSEDTKKEGGGGVVKLPPCSPKNQKEKDDGDADSSLPWSSQKIGQLTRELTGGGGVSS